MAAALELQYLPPRRGRSSSVPWSTESTGPDLALVQFSQAKVLARSMSSRSGSTAGEKNGRGQPVQTVASSRVRLKQLSDLQSSALAVGRGSSSNRSLLRKQRRRTDHEREYCPTGDCHLKLQQHSRMKSKFALHLC